MKSAKTPPKRPSISVTGRTYERLRSAVVSTSVPKFVDGLLTSALADPVIMERLLKKCRSKEPG